MPQSEDSQAQVLRQLATVNRVARIALQDMDLQPMLQRIVDALAEEFGWEFVACATIDAERGEFVCQAVHSRIEGGIAVGYRRALGSGVVGECAQTGRTLDIEDASRHPNLVDTLGGTGSELCVPVLHQGEVLAVLNAESRERGAFRGQRALLETVADQVAGVLKAARLLEQLTRANLALQQAYSHLESQSQRDGLTGIGNRGRFDHWLAEATDACALGRRPLAVLLADVDHFKAYNDGYGHLAGDACLREVSALLSGLVEGTTVRLGRYGGEEFGLVAPGLDVAGALALAERLRKVVEARGLEHRHAGGGCVTVSLGVAVAVPGGGDGPDRLLGHADAALYEAKRAGRNCVRVRAVAPG